MENEKIGEDLIKAMHLVEKDYKLPTYALSKLVALAFAEGKLKGMRLARKMIFDKERK